MWKETSYLIVICACACAVPNGGASDALSGSSLSQDLKHRHRTIYVGNNVRTVDTNELPPAHTPSSPPPPEEKAVNERYPQAVLFGPTCGGTIISPTWVITAAHCTLFTKGRYVLAGTNNSRDGSGIRSWVKRLVIHPLFTVGPYWLNAAQFNISQVAARYDFLLAELETPLPIDNKIIASAIVNDNLELKAGLNVGYAGYGAEKHGQTMRHLMHAMDLQLIPDSECESKLEQFNGEDMLCARGVPPRFDSACNGDSGSGLISEGRLLGVASWVQNDAKECYPGAIVVFSNIARVRDWIKSVTGI